ncbi:hypothetical protein K9857_20810 [Pseudomonas sp. REP124]|uniref:hypothetical protein n=1 Tax=Pseudomonas sp. REP124 TaxID=2875731 RepID=UPI001CC95A23|nr:hypothetical protein [Pseudomonas sp. REP124]MBZ9783979.1 hypothetical protein [Pseudomonas sp. REP124]
MKKHSRPAADHLPNSADLQPQATDLRDAISASRYDRRPAIAADAVFAELDALVNEIAAEKNHSAGLVARDNPERF